MNGLAMARKPESRIGNVQVTIKACDMCRKKKIRCEQTADGCRQCTKYKTHCHFTPISTNKKPRRPAGYRYVQELRGRLEKLEDMLDLGVDENGRPRSHDVPFGVLDLKSGKHEPISHTTAMSWIAESYAPSSASGSKRRKPPEPLWQSPQPQTDEENISEGIILGDEPQIFSMEPSPSWKQGLALGPFSMPTFQRLPALSTARELVKDYFQSFNDFFPLFDKVDFTRDLDDKYPHLTPQNPASWACVNVVLCMAHRFRAMRTPDPSYENAQSCGYIHNVLAVVSELNILHQSLPAIQALVGMAMVLQGSPNPQTASMLTASAVRMAQAIGLHRQHHEPSLAGAEVEQRKRVFWITFSLDKDISIRMGQPFAQDDDDMDAELPSRSLIQPSQCGNVPCSINVFHSRIGLAVIQGQVYKRLYSVAASRQTDAQKAAMAQELDSVLQYWRLSVPLELEEADTASSFSPLATGSLHILILRFIYVNCLVMIHKHLPSMGLYTGGLNPISEDAFASAENICMTECRKAIRLIRLIPQGDYACVWIILHPFFAAVTYILGSVIRNPEAHQDFFEAQDIGSFLRLLEKLANDQRRCARHEEAAMMYKQCYDMLDSAKSVVDMVRSNAYMQGPG